MTFPKYTASVSDTDLLINITKVGAFHLLENLFNKVIIPKEIRDHEMLKKGKDERYNLVKYMRVNPQTPLEYFDKSTNKIFNKIATNEYLKMTALIGPGEAQCCGYAKASGTNIIISDNVNDYPDMIENGYIVLGHRDLISLSVRFGLMSKVDGEVLYKQINSNLDKPSGFSFDETIDRTLTRIHKNGWNEQLGIK
ncbi:hypothetical protein [Bacillus sp. UNCCL81]|uniref:hypothetical protein n=1 Tax=Bacillus sp. UNCCL81 TaxID=1502755 RepID=UPI0003F878E3|nr:hypothetical protein [Bacillus sp. UNCCL81]SFD60498.1 Predicted nucleic acid-binding protein, contains PIN domain [Bacillus sp. UNCCL81]